MWTDIPGGVTTSDAGEIASFIGQLQAQPPAKKNSGKDKKKEEAQREKARQDAIIHNIRGGPMGANMTEKERAEYNKENAWGVLGYVIGEGVGYAVRPIASWLGELFSTAIDWTINTSDPLVGELANSIDLSLGKGTVKGVGLPYDGEFGSGDIDISLENTNIEVKSGQKMKLTQSLKNAAQANSEGKGYYLYMPNATSAQIREAALKGITVIKNEPQLFNILKTK